MDLKTLEDYQKAARSWVEHVIPSDATFIKKLCCISTQSLNVFRDLLWLTRKEPLKPDFYEGYLACPVDLWRPVLNEYYPHDLWLYSVLRAVKILSFWKPIFDNAGSDLESSHQNDLGLYEIWPKMTDATTAFNGAGSSAAEAIINGLWIFLLNTVECFCSRDRDMPDIFLVSENVMGYRNDQKNMEIWPNQHPAIKLWKDATLKEAKEYFPSAKWPLADLDGEYSRVSILLDHEVTLALEKRSERNNGDKAGDVDKPKKELEPLSANAAAVYELLKALPQYRGMKGREILKALENQKPPIFIDQSTLTKNIIPGLRPYGVINKRGAGYYISK